MYFAGCLFLKSRPGCCQLNQKPRPRHCCQHMMGQLIFIKISEAILILMIKNFLSLVQEDREDVVLLSL